MGNKHMALLDLLIRHNLFSDAQELARRVAYQNYDAELRRIDRGSKNFNNMLLLQSSFLGIDPSSPYYTSKVNQAYQLFNEQRSIVADEYNAQLDGLDINTTKFWVDEVDEASKELKPIFSDFSNVSI